MGLEIGINGVNKAITKVEFGVNSVWKEVNKSEIGINNAWKEGYTSSIMFPEIPTFAGEGTPHAYAYATAIEFKNIQWDKVNNTISFYVPSFSATFTMPYAYDNERWYHVTYSIVYTDTSEATGGWDGDLCNQSNFDPQITTIITQDAQNVSLSTVERNIKEIKSFSITRRLEISEGWIYKLQTDTIDKIMQ